MSSDVPLADVNFPQATDREIQAGVRISNDIENPPSDTFTEALPPVDGGRDAWLFLIGAGLLEFFVWGWPTCVGILRVYWLNELFGGRDESVITLAATLQSGLLYLGVGFIAP